MDFPSNISQKKSFSLSFFLLDIGKKEEKNFAEFRLPSPFLLMLEVEVLEASFLP